LSASAPATASRQAASTAGPASPGPLTPLQTYRRLLRYLRPHRLQFALGIFGGVVYSLAMASLPAAAKYFGDLLQHPDERAVLWMPLGLIAIFFCRGAGDFTQTYFMGYVGRQIVKQIRDEIFASTLRLPVRHFDRSSSAAMLSQLTFNTEQIGQATTDSIVIVVRASLTIVGYIGFMFYVNAKLAAIALTLGPVVGWLMSIVNRRFRRYSRRIQDSMVDVTRVAKEGFEAPRLIKVYNAEAQVSGQFERANERNRLSFMRLVLTRGLANPVVQQIASLGGAFVLSIALADAMHGRMDAGDLIGFFVALGSITQPLKELIGASGPIQQAVAAGQVVFETLDAPSEPAGGSFTVACARGAVEIESVSFTYDTGKQAALHDISLSVPAGQKVAIVGRSGSGKSTLVSLIPRFYEAQRGIVRVDGHDVRDYDLHNLREQIAVVSQEVVLFDDTVRNNITFGREVSDAQVERAAEAAHATEFIRNLPLGFDTVVGDRGVLLSGGQRQRISIARALLKDAPILILDEATSALDAEAERHIQAALQQLVRNRTTFIIAHRLSTVEQADRIVVLDAGVIVESGTHAELMETGGVYATLYRLNFND
jgi:ATP-binding cassette, subfamily B, bacterial MsbA